jgi:hypothetical protein
VLIVCFKTLIGFSESHREVHAALDMLAGTCITVILLIFTNRWIHALHSENKKTSRCLNGVSFLVALFAVGSAITAVVLAGLVWSRQIFWDLNLDIAILPAVFVPPLVFQCISLTCALVFLVYTWISCSVIRKVENGMQSALFMGVVAFLILCACIARVVVLSLIVADYYLEIAVQYFCGTIFPETLQYGCLILTICVWVFVQRKKMAGHFRLFLFCFLVVC